MKKKHTITAKEFDKIFDDGGDISQYMDFKNPMKWDEFIQKHKIELKAPKPKRMNLDLPEWVMDKVDNCANALGMPRQALIRVWILEKLGIPLGKVGG